MNDLMNKLLKTSSPSGNEENIQNVISDEIVDYVDSLYKDPLGNLIAIKNGDSDKKIMFCAHSDEIGVIVTNIDDNGFIRIAPIGGVNVHTSLYQRIEFLNGVKGIVAYDENVEKIDKLKFSNLYVDIGSSSKEETEKLIKIGDVAVFSGEISATDKYITSKSLDDKIGVYILINVIKSLKNTKNTLYFVFSVQEELGLRGAKTATFGIEPDIAIAVDVTDTGDTPNCKDFAVKTGRGPAIKIKDNSVICSKNVCDYLKNIAKENNIPYQLEVLQAGGTDAGAIHLTREGVYTGAISIACRYIHTPAETASIADIENAIKLINYSIENEFNI